MIAAPPHNPADTSSQSRLGHSCSLCFWNELLNARRMPPAQDFLYQFSRCRFALIRNAEFATLNNMFLALKSKARAVGEQSWWILGELLLKHNAWHTGAFRSVSDLLVDVDKASPWYELSRIFAVYYLNTAAEFKSSFRIASQVFDASSEKSCSSAALFIGCDLKCAAVEWRFWNRSENLSLVCEGLQGDLAFVDDVLAGKYDCSSISKTRLLLAIGMFSVNVCDYSLARHCLVQALGYAGGKASMWYPRIVSGLSLCAYFLSHKDTSRSFLEDCVFALPKSIGPVGWQLRVAYLYYLHGHVTRRAGYANVFSMTPTRRRRYAIMYGLIFIVPNLVFTRALRFWRVTVVGPRR